MAQKTIHRWKKDTLTAQEAQGSSTTELLALPTLARAGDGEPEPKKGGAYLWQEQVP